MPQNYTKQKGSRFVPDADKFLFNIDTFWYNITADNYQAVMDSGFRELLRSAREHLLDTDEKLTLTVDLAGYQNPVTFEVHGGQPPMYQYSIRNEDMAIYFSKNFRDSQSPMKVQINQFKLWEKGVIDSYLESLQVLASLGFAHGKAKLNRVDFAVHSDQFKFNLKDFRTFEYPRNIADDNKPNWWRLDPITGEFETVYYGARNFRQLRIYNKSVEAKKKLKTYFLDMYTEKGMDADNVWNIEFEVRRDFLKECKGEDGQALFDDLDEVFQENRLSLLWTELLKDFYFPKNAFWTTLEQGQTGKFEQCKGYLERRKDNHANFEREVAQIRGRLMTGLLNEADNDVETAISIFRKHLHLYEERKGKNFTEDLNKKKAKYQDADINKTISNVTDLESKKVSRESKKITAVKNLLSPRKITQQNYQKYVSELIEHEPKKSKRSQKEMQQELHNLNNSLEKQQLEYKENLEENIKFFEAHYKKEHKKRPSLPTKAEIVTYS